MAEPTLVAIVGCVAVLILMFMRVPIAIVLGIVALNQIKQNREEGHGLAVAGIAIGALSLVVGLVFFVFALSS